MSYESDMHVAFSSNSVMTVAHRFCMLSTLQIRYSLTPQLQPSTWSLGPSRRWVSGCWLVYSDRAVSLSIQPPDAPSPPAVSFWCCSLPSAFAWYEAVRYNAHSCVYPRSSDCACLVWLRVGSCLLLLIRNSMFLTWGILQTRGLRLWVFMQLQNC